ncbi:helix-turn-helix domain-containing protein [Companilactobacillus mishanensis]|uniref:Helix-turn-helix domain-containing protein n=1 Tax=Companilactobacillus mishanensis TaxID=2486008 RepID=A0A5P0ZFU3_9LACO|nr:helix-turn-helix domain-containing protein [Companilactobacillus mishanensis]MQS51888.1 helix-turn-helix domain-containing protein [Companilactobacillus mishanensis]MQS88997.1 helix-turn-helix domain-containing protein [Companilactobacillus mishanensis]
MDEIGQKLRNARIKKGYTIDDLQNVTKIQKRYLIAIEEGQFDHLPGDFYVRAFIKQYSDAVGIPSDELLEEYKAEIPDSQPHEPNEGKDEEKTRSISDSSDSIFSRMRNYIPQIIVGVIIVIIIGVIIFGMVHRSQSSSQVTIPKDNTEESSSSKSSSNSNKKTTTTKKKSASETKSISIKESDTKGTYTVKNLPTGKDADVVVTADGGQAWISYTVGSDTTPTWQEAISDGDKKSTKLTSDTKKFAIHTGNIHNTKISIAGKNVDLGSTSDSSTIVRTLTFNVE